MNRIWRDVYQEASKILPADVFEQIEREVSKALRKGTKAGKTISTSHILPKFLLDKETRQWLSRYGKELIVAIALKQGYEVEFLIREGNDED